MTPKTARISTAGGLVAVLTAAYFFGSVQGPATVKALPQQNQPGAPVTQSNTVSVGGVGRVTGTPDTLGLALSVESHGGDVSKALAAAGVVHRKVVAALKAQGVLEADLKSNGLNVRPNLRYDKKNNGAPTIIDYIATQSLSAKLRNLDKAGASISAAVAAGGNDVRVDGIAFELERNATLVAQARDIAFADAKTKAEQYAKLASRSLGAVSTVTEQSQDSPPLPGVYASSAAASMDSRQASVPLERGSQEVVVLVHITWALL